VLCRKRDLLTKRAGIPITDSHFWQDEEECTQQVFKSVFRSSTAEEMPMLQERLDCLREAGKVLYEKHSCKFTDCVDAANQSAASLVNLLVKDFPCLRDEHRFEGKAVRIYKRAQILVADIWACFNGQSYGTFHDIDKITMFADYRIPQMLHSLGCLMYSPPLEGRIRRQEEIESGEKWEVELRGCTIWTVELIRRQILRDHPESNVNSVLIDTFLYDTLKEKEAAGGLTEMIPHHRTRSMWY
jgi:Potential Queuosine, Q, salvage protein family